MSLDGRTIFVAGATGLAGASVVRAILDAEIGVSIRASHRSDTGCFIRDPRVSYVRADLTDPVDCAKAVAGTDAAVLTAAYSAGAQQAISQPWLSVTDNVVMDARLLQALHDAGVPRVVYVSSATLYQEREGYITEDDLDLNLDPPSAYLGLGWTKRYVEKLCRFWHDKSGMEVLVARASNVFGPFAKFDPKTANFIPALIRKAVDHMDPFEVWGHAGVVRDVIYAADFGEAIVALLNARHIGFGIFNVGTGRRTTVGEVVDWILRASGHTPSSVVWTQNRPTTVGFRALDCSRIGAATGWRPRIGIEDGIAATVQWWRENQGSWER